MVTTRGLWTAQHSTHDVTEESTTHSRLSTWQHNIIEILNAYSWNYNFIINVFVINCRHFTDVRFLNEISKNIFTFHHNFQENKRITNNCPNFCGHFIQGKSLHRLQKLSEAIIVMGIRNRTPKSHTPTPQTFGTGVCSLVWFGVCVVQGVV